MIATLIFAVAVALVLAGMWAIAAPRHPALLLASLVAAVAFAWQAVEHWLGYLECERVLSTRERYDLDLAGSGERVLRVGALPGVRGIQIRVVRNDGVETHYPSFEACRWKARTASGNLPITGDSQRGLVEIDSKEELGDGARAWIELAYTVDENSRPLLQQVHLEAGAPWFLWKGCHALRDVYRIVAGICLAGAMLGLGGFVCQVVRAVRTRRGPQSKGG